jgi:hypothetical protein
MLDAHLQHAHRHLPHMKRVELVYVVIEEDHERVETTRSCTGSLVR